MTFLAHAAARTRRIRLSTAITVLPLENPVRLAEDVSVVDTLSGGRVEIGVGSGASEAEYAAFGRDVGRKRELTSEGLEVLRGALANHEVGTAGFTIQPPAADFTGRIWQAVFSAPGAGYAAKAASNLLLNRAAYGYDERTDEVQRPWADAYLGAWEQPRIPRIGLSRFVFPAKDARTALDQIGRARPRRGHPRAGAHRDRGGAGPGLEAPERCRLETGERLPRRPPADGSLR